MKFIFDVLSVSNNTHYVYEVDASNQALALEKLRHSGYPIGLNDPITIDTPQPSPRSPDVLAVCVYPGKQR